jgi:hypothetical protein
MASHTHFLIDALTYLADPERSPQTPAAEQPVAGAARADRTADPRLDRRPRARRPSARWIAVVVGRAGSRDAGMPTGAMRSGRSA